MSANLSNAGVKPVRHDAFLQKAGADRYKTKRKLPEPTLCPGCGAVFADGDWQWQELSVANEALCPACLRQHDNSPAGYVTLSGNFVAAHEAEVMGVVLNQEERERVEYPLRRVMNVEKSANGFLVTTTDVNLAHDIGEALRRAFNGNLTLNFNRRTNLLQVHWQR